MARVNPSRKQSLGLVVLLARTRDPHEFSVRYGMNDNTNPYAPPAEPSAIPSARFRWRFALSLLLACVVWIVGLVLYRPTAYQWPVLAATFAACVLGAVVGFRRLSFTTLGSAVAASVVLPMSLVAISTIEGTLASAHAGGLAMCAVIGVIVGVFFGATVEAIDLIIRLTISR